jgi:DNA-binding transcriptional LysR family regulator
MLDVRKLATLRAVATEGSIAEAARSLRCTRSAVSQQLTALESQAGVQLIDRTGNRVRLTRLGEALVEHTERILAELRAAEALLDGNSADVTGTLRVGVPFGEGSALMGRALRRVQSQHPALRIQLFSATNQTTEKDLRRERFDLAVMSRFGPPWKAAAAGLREWQLGLDPLRVCVPAGHRLAGESSCTLADLRAEPWILSPTTALGQLTTTLCAAAGFEPKVGALVDDVNIAIGLAARGWGVTIAPELAPATPESAIVRLRIRDVEAVRRVVLVARAGEYSSPRIAVVLNAIQEITEGDHRGPTRLVAAG